MLAVLGVDAGLGVVVKEGIGTRAVVPDALAVNDANSPGSRFLAHVRVKELIILREWDRGVRVGLVVGSLGLDGTKPDILSARQLVLGELRVLRSSAHEPDGTLRLNEHTATVVDVDLRVVVLVELVVGSP